MRDRIARLCWMVAAFLLVATFSHAQLPLTHGGLGAIGGSFTPSCTESSNFLARATGVTSNTDKQNYDNLLCGLETDGIGCSNTIDALYVLAAVDHTTALLNLCSASFALVEHGTVSFSAYHGYTGNASDFYLDTQFVPNAGGTFFARDSASVSIYILSNRTTDNNYFALGTTSSGTNYTIIRAKNGSGNADFEINDNTFPNAASSTAKGQWVAARTSSSAVALYLNGNTTAFASSGSDSSSGPSTNSITLFADNDVGSVIGFTSDQQSAAHIGAAMNATQASNLASRINTYMTAYGINVY